MSSIAPNHHGLNWFLGEFNNESLDLTPEYQRNLVWSITQKCYLIDSILASCPIPQVFLNVVTKGEGINKKTIYEVIDGQQRLNAIIDFMRDGFPLRKLPGNYLVSADYKKCHGRKFSQISEHLQQRIWDYPLAVQEVRNLSAEEIREMFARLNWVVVKLSDQEIRHSIYSGEFISMADDLSDDEFWDKHKIFTKRDVQRMGDVEFVSELLALLDRGIQDGKKGLDALYAEYEEEYPNKTTHKRKFRQIVGKIDALFDAIGDVNIFTGKPDLYGLFAALSATVLKKIDVENLAKELKSFSRRQRRLAELKQVDEYKNTVIQGSTKRLQREARMKILKTIIDRNLA